MPHPVEHPEPSPVRVQPIAAPTPTITVTPNVLPSAFLPLPTSLPTPLSTPLPPAQDDLLCLLFLRHLAAALPLHPIHSALAQLLASRSPDAPSLSPSPTPYHLRDLLCPSLDPAAVPPSVSQLLLHLCLSDPPSLHPQLSSLPQPSDLRFQKPPSHELYKRSSTSSSRLFRRQSIQGDGSGPSADGYPSCTAVSNAVLSCFPQSNTTLVQNTWSKFIWNNNYPTFIGSRLVDIYLFNAQSESIVANWTGVANDRGMMGIYAGANWFPNETSWVDGQNRSFPYFFVITGGGMPLTGGEQHQATFTVVQTAQPLSLASASAAAFSSAFLHPNTSQPSTASAPVPTSTSSALQHASNDDSFPRWQIALIVVLGVLALVTFLVATYLTVHNARRRRQIRNWRQVGLGGSGGSVASHSPMIQNPEGTALIGIAGKQRPLSPNSSRPGSPLSATATATGAASQAYPPPGFGAIIAGTQSGTKDTPGPDGPISSVDASIMADAFRKALRKPEFAPTSQDVSPDDAPPPDASPPDAPPLALAPPRTRQSMKAQVMSIDEEMGGDAIDDDLDDEDAREIMDRELASEGRSMTSVDVRKRPEVHS